MSEGILKGIKIIERGTYVAVPYCTRELADLGAEVIKIESPRGEDYRVRMGRNFQLPNKPESDWCFTPYNVNKKSLCLDLKKPEAVKAFMELIATADVFISNTREEVLDRLGISFATLREKYPRLICGNISGFGTKGPDKDAKGYDLTSFWSGCGAAVEWNPKENRMFKPFYGFGDAITGAQLTVGILAALLEREKTGRGDVVRTSLLGTGLWTNVCGLLRYQAGHKFPKAFTDPIVPMDNLYETKDGFYITINESNYGDHYMWYLELFDAMDKKDDPDWTTIEGYCSNIPEKVKFFEQAIKKLTKDEIVNFLAPRGGVVSVMKSTDEILTNEQAWANDMLVKMTTEGGDELTIANIPVRFENHGLIEKIEAARQLGEDTVEILKGIGYSDEAIASLLESKAAVAFKK